MVLVVVWVGDIAMAENASIKEQAVRVVEHDQTESDAKDDEVCLRGFDYGLYT